MTARQKMNGICAIVLAAGESKRMGSPKMLLPWDNKTVIETVTENVMAADVDGVILVLGAAIDEIMKVTDKYAVMHCFNENYRTGMLSSVRCGMSLLPPDCRAALIMPGDQPMTGTVEINRVIKAYRESGRGIVMASCKGRRGHPLVVDAMYRDEVMQLPDGEGLRALAERHPDDVLEAETDDPSVLKDIDTQEDYLNELNINKRDGRDNPVQTERQGDGAGH